MHQPLPASAFCAGMGWKCKTPVTGNHPLAGIANSSAMRGRFCWITAIACSATIIPSPPHWTWGIQQRMWSLQSYSILINPTQEEREVARYIGQDFSTHLHHLVGPFHPCLMDWDLQRLGESVWTGIYTLADLVKGESCLSMNPTLEWLERQN